MAASAAWANAPPRYWLAAGARSATSPTATRKIGTIDKAELALTNSEHGRLTQ